MSTLGIDLGTTNTVAAIDRHVLELSAGTADGRFLPSAVAFLPNGANLIGARARRRRVIDPKNTIYSAKRLIGRRWHSSDAKTFMSLYPFDVVESADGDAVFATRRGEVSPVEVGAMLLETVKRRVPASAAIDHIVVTVPSLFGPRSRNATLRAAIQAGLPELQILDEPIAAVHAYLPERGSALGLVTVYDLGGGTFDLAVVDCRREPIEVLGHQGDLYLGGDDIDQALADWARRKILEQQGWDAKADAEVYDRLVAECEAAKIRLASADRTALDIGRVDPLAPQGAAPIEIDRECLTVLASDLVKKTFALCDQVLSSVGLRASDIDTVILAGGTTLLPMIRENVRKYFDREPLGDYHPMQVVSIGASAVTAPREP